MTVTATGYRSFDAVAEAVAVRVLGETKTGAVGQLDRAAIECALDDEFHDAGESPIALRTRIVTAAAWRAFELWRQLRGGGDDGSNA